MKKCFIFNPSHAINLSHSGRQSEHECVFGARLFSWVVLRKVNSETQHSLLVDWHVTSVEAGVKTLTLRPSWSARVHRLLFELLIVNYFSVSQTAERLRDHVWWTDCAGRLQRPLMLIYFLISTQQTQDKGGTSHRCCIFTWRPFPCQNSCLLCFCILWRSVSSAES